MQVDPILIWAWYYFIEELQDFITLGAKRYMWDSGSKNLMDWASIIAALGTITEFIVALKFYKAPYSQHFWTSAWYAQQYQNWAGFMCFFMIMKVKSERRVFVYRICRV